ncbi:hypothetical protein BJ741DRAFT_592575 [Chytriomyces cf. hyalinus JEL632]|nr:hypothetical protein BJ741DRAFT_592575 [Chytriomyces cf. hyalinus JEL632]
MRVCGVCVKGLGFFLVLRFAQASVHSRSASSKWSTSQYLMFLATGRKQLHPESGNTKSPRLHETQSQEAYASCRSTRFLSFAARKLLLNVATISVAKAFCLKHDYSWNASLLSLLDLHGVMLHLAYGFLMYSEIDFFYHIVTIPIFITLDVPYVPIFQAPYLATSLQDFWSRRWNHPVCAAFHQIIFEPTLKALESKRQALHSSSKSRHSRKFNKKPKPIHLAIATLSTFLVSGLFHEYCVLVLMPEQMNGSNLAYFTIHGCLCVLHVALQKSLGFGSRWGLHWAWNIPCWFGTMCHLLVTAPLFIAPYVKSKLFMLFPVPETVLIFVQRLF